MHSVAAVSGTKSGLLSRGASGSIRGAGGDVEMHWPEGCPGRDGVQRTRKPQREEHTAFLCWGLNALYLPGAALGSAQASAEGYGHAAPGRQAWGCSGPQGSSRFPSQEPRSAAPAVPSSQEVPDARPAGTRPSPPGAPALREACGCTSVTWCEQPVLSSALGSMVNRSLLH